MSTSIDQSPIINALISTFPGLPSLTIPLPSTSSILSLHKHIATRLSLPSTLTLRLLTTSGKELPPASTTPISTLTHGSSPLLPLSLLSTLPGGKGGFGSQLRAAGGRMSSRKKRGQEENSDSCRNLDGRRIRTVKEAKALAAYLEIKPEMDRKEREKRKERWRKVVEQANRREAEERGDAVLGGTRFEDTEWLEKTEEEKERLREAVIRAMKEGVYEDGNDDKHMRDASPGSSGTSSGADEEEAEEGVEVVPKPAKKIAVPKPPSPPAVVAAKPRKFAGFDDDDDEFMSDVDEEDEDEEEEEDPETAKGKGKGKAKA